MFFNHKAFTIMFSNAPLLTNAPLFTITIPRSKIRAKSTFFNNFNRSDY